MLGWAFTFLIIALIAAILGATQVMGAAAWIAWVLFVVFVILSIVSFVFNAGRRPPA